ncbi:MAG TPA: nuclear transport factor 2 family protein [Gemmatimonadales bacterium]|nr:nuclear transport factor 2 family protein [Gemmatimonadales bacterium]
MLRTVRTALFLLTAALPVQAQSDAAVSKGIHDREVQWRTAISLGNWSAVESFLAPDFVMTTADGGRLDRDKYLKELQRGTTTFAPVPDPTYKVLVYGQTAVHLGEANRMSTGSDGGSILVHVVWTDTWVRTSDGRWVLLAAQVAVAPAK